MGDQNEVALIWNTDREHVGGVRRRRVVDFLARKKQKTRLHVVQVGRPSNTTTVLNIIKLLSFLLIALY